MRNSGQDKNGVSKGKTNDERDDVNDDVDALFRLPLAEFTGARNTLAARLKKDGLGDDAARVKALAKPSISAWAVNQLYWNHREAFDQLIASGERFHKAQTSRSGVKAAEMRTALDARREGLTQLSDIAASVLQDGGHNPSPETIRRITTTLEAMSAYASRSNAPRPGRLTADVDPPGFELFGAAVPASATKLTLVTPAQKPNSSTKTAQRKVAPVDEVRQLAETRKAKLAAARVSLQDAKRSLTEVRAKSQSLEAARKRADTEAKQAEKHRRDAEERLEKAKAASEDAARRARSVAVEAEEAASEVEDASLEVEQASSELEKLLAE